MLAVANSLELNRQPSVPVGMTAQPLLAIVLLIQPRTGAGVGDFIDVRRVDGVADDALLRMGFPVWR